MDTSEEYIKMCEEAKEIQKDIPLFSRRIHSFFWADGKIGGWLVVVNTKTEKYIWLPRQDQLQGMVIERRNPFDGRKLNKNTAISRLNSSFFGAVSMNWYSNEYFWQFNSFEQLWLAFVMKKKYNKIWDDENEKWIKQ